MAAKILGCHFFDLSPRDTDCWASACLSAAARDPLEDDDECGGIFSLVPEPAPEAVLHVGRRCVAWNESREILLATESVGEVSESLDRLLSLSGTTATVRDRFSSCVRRDSLRTGLNWIHVVAIFGTASVAFTSGKRRGTFQNQETIKAGFLTGPSSLKVIIENQALVTIIKRLQNILNTMNRIQKRARMMATKMIMMMMTS